MAKQRRPKQGTPQERLAKATRLRQERFFRAQREALRQAGGIAAGGPTASPAVDPDEQMRRLQADMLAAGAPGFDPSEVGPQILGAGGRGGGKRQTRAEAVAAAYAAGQAEAEAAVNAAQLKQRAERLQSGRETPQRLMSWRDLGLYPGGDPILDAPQPSTPEEKRAEEEAGRIAQARLARADVRDLSRSRRAEAARRPFHIAGTAIQLGPSGGIVDRLANAPTPGGVWGLLFAVLFLLAVAVPAGPQGQTRGEMLWRALTGGARMPPSANAQSKDAANTAIAQGNLAAAVLGVGGVAAIQQNEQTAVEIGNILWNTLTLGQ